MIREFDWSKFKRLSTVLAAACLMGLSILGFMGGLNFVGEWAGPITFLLWISFTIIQFVGNDLDNHEDWVFTLLWIFSYMVGIGASTWSLYGWITIGNEPLHWIVAAGLGGTAEVAPERLIVMFLRSGMFHNVKIKSKPISVPNNDNRQNNAPRNIQPAPMSRPDPYKNQFQAKPIGPAGQFNKSNNINKRPTYVIQDEDGRSDYRG